MLDHSVEELQNRYLHWRKLEVAAERAHGARDDLTTLYRNKREQVEQLADTLGTSVRHLDPWPAFETCPKCDGEEGHYTPSSTGWELCSWCIAGKRAST